MRKNLNVQLYSSCNCDCSFCHFKDKCYNKINPQFALDYLKENPDINYILLTGGEPTLAIDEYKEIISNVDINEKRFVLQTNGWWGDNENIKNIIKEYPPSLVHLSVDSEKQKIIDIGIVKKAYDFLKENNIDVKVFNHSNNVEEYEYYEKYFENLYRAVICYEGDGHTHDCGTALLSTNKIGKIDIKGWR